MFDDMEKDVFEIADDEDNKEAKKKSKKSKKAKQEYESAFDGEEKMMHKLSNIKSDMTQMEKYEARFKMFKK